MSRVLAPRRAPLRPPFAFLWLLVLAPIAVAQQGEDATGSAGLEEVVVTAQKVETRLQSTPIAIAVLGAEDLRNRSVRSLADLADGAIPSLRIAPFYSRTSALSVGIRGIVPFDANQPSRDAGVGVYIDGVYLGRSQGLGAALYDIERIEVLKGPQGTLFGRNSTGGALSLITRKPSGEFNLRQTVGLRNFDGYLAETHLDLDRIGDVSLKFDGIVTKRDGTVVNPLQGQEDYNAFDRRGLHARALWEPTESFTADYSFDISYDATTPYYAQITRRNPAAPPFAPLVQVQPGRATVADIGVPLEESVGKTRGHRLHLTWQLGESTELRSISSYRELSQSQFDNAGAHLAPFVPNGRFGRYSLADLDQSQYSQEFQIVGSRPGLTFVAGAFYYHERGSDWAWSPNTMQWNATGTAATVLPSLAAGAASPFPDRASDAEIDSYALFGQATWAPAAFEERLKLTVGARWTRDDKSGLLSKVNGRDTAFRFGQKTDRIDPMVTLAFDPNDDVHVYAKWGTAYRAGGANSRSVTYRAFEPEEVATTELGFKSEFWGRRARFNVAAYETRITDVQVDFLALGLDPTLPNRTTIETVNAPGEGKIRGYEVDLSLAPLSGLTFSASYAYTKGTLPQAANPFLGNRLETLYIVYTPQNAYSAAIDYEFPLGSLEGLFHLDVNAADGYHSLSSEPVKTDSSTVANARLALRGVRLGSAATLELSLWSRNVFDAEHSFYASEGSFARLGSIALFNEPRTYGLDATVRF